MQPVEVPIDIYDSTTEMVIVMPLGWVSKKSVSVDLKWLTLHISGTRQQPDLKETLLPTQEHCFWWPFEKVVELPENANLGQIQSELSRENILIVLVPKVVVPEKIMVKVK
jgi:HSP20 family molecular chaperone IbpA